MTLNQLQQVAVTYAMRPKPLTWLLMLTIGPAAIANLVFYAMHPRAPDGDFTPAAFFPFYMLCLLPYMACHKHVMRSQFDHPRAALTPNFRSAHLTLWWSIALLTMGVIPWAIATGLSVSPWMLWAGLAILCFTNEKPSLAVVAVPLIFTLPILLSRNTVVESHLSLWRPWLQAEGFRYPLLVGTTICLWTGTLYRQFQRAGGYAEDAPRAASLQWDAEDVCSARSFGTGMERWREPPTTKDLTWTALQIDGRLRRSRTGSFARKLRVTMLPPIPSPTQMLLPVAVSLGLAAIYSQRAGISWTLDLNGWRSLVKLLPATTLAAAVLPIVSTAKRRPYMAIERMLPTTNQEYTDALMFNSMRLAAILWIAGHSAVLAATYFLPWTAPLPCTPTTLATYALLSISGLLLAFGFTATTAFSIDFFSLLITAIVVFGATVFLPWYWSELQPREGNGGAIVMSLIAAGLGAALIAQARRSWREMELG